MDCRERRQVYVVCARQTAMPRRWRGDPSRLGRRQADRMSDPELQSVTPVEISPGHPLAKALLALNNAHARELSWLEPERRGPLVPETLLAPRNGELAPLLFAFRQGCCFATPQFLLVP